MPNKRRTPKKTCRPAVAAASWMIEAANEIDRQFGLPRNDSVISAVAGVIAEYTPKRLAYDQPSPAAKFIGEKLSAELIGADLKQPGYIRWRRVPMGQGGESYYEFSTPAALRMGETFFGELADAVFTSGMRAAEDSLPEEIRRLLDRD